MAPRDGSNIYHRPPGTDGIPDTTIESTKYNAYVGDVEQDLNLPRPIVAGGTGANNATDALTNLSGEMEGQIVTNYDNQIFVSGSFYSAGSATNQPVAGHAFVGHCYSSDPLPVPPAAPLNLNLVIEARDQNDTTVPGRVYVREKKVGVWGAWTVQAGSVADLDAAYVNVAGDTMTGPLALPTPAIADNSTKAATTAFVNQDKIIPAATDLNTITAPGTYACPDTSCTNGPTVGGQWYLHVQTFGGAPTFVAQRAVSVHGATPEIYLRTNEGGTWRAWQQLATTAFAASAATLRNYIAGLTLAVSGGTNSFAVNPGTATDSSNAVMMSLAAVTAKTTAAWAVGNGGGGLDTGAIAPNAWYHVHLIRRPDTGNVDVLVSLSATAPTLPANYTQFRRIGSMLTISSLWVRLTQVGDTFLWGTQVADLSAVNVQPTPTLYVLSVPPGLNVTALFHGGFNNTSAAGFYVFFSSPSQSTAVVGIASLYNAITAVPSGSDYQIVVNATAQIYISTGTTTGNKVWIDTYGWIDRRGRDN
jgi:hypothetical protein